MTQTSERPEMAYIVTESCINCKHQDCVEICPVDCFYEGENFVVINPNECIDCGICETECPVDAIKHHEDCDRKWVSINVAASKVWPNITTKGEVPADARTLGVGQGQARPVVPQRGAARSRRLSVGGGLGAHKRGQSPPNTAAQRERENSNPSRRSKC